MTRLRLLAAIMLSLSPILNVRGEDVAPLPVIVPPDPNTLFFDGRFATTSDTVDSDKEPGLSCEWPGSSVTLHFTGTALNAWLDDEGHNYWQILVDGKFTGKLALGRGPALYNVTHDLAPGEHIVKLIKATESFGGATTILGFQLDTGAKILPVARPKRRIEIVGDSISCGFGVEASGPEEPFSLGTENAARAYGSLAAQLLHAGYTCVAWTGRKMWPDNTVPEIYDRTFARKETPLWNFKINIPDAVIINLGTNDFGKETPDETGWIAAYRKFIARVRSHYPDAVIYCATGPMLSDENDARHPKSTLLDWVKQIVAAENAAGDKNVHQLDFGEQDPKNGLGANYHPGNKTQEIMAVHLVQTLQRDLGWH